MIVPHVAQPTTLSNFSSPSVPSLNTDESNQSEHVRPIDHSPIDSARQIPRYVYMSNAKCNELAARHPHLLESGVCGGLLKLCRLKLVKQSVDIVILCPLASFRKRSVQFEVASNVNRRRAHWKMS